MRRPSPEIATALNAPRPSPSVSTSSTRGAVSATMTLGASVGVGVVLGVGVSVGVGVALGRGVMVGVALGTGVRVGGTLGEGGGVISATVDWHAASAQHTARRSGSSALLMAFVRVNLFTHYHLTDVACRRHSPVQSVR